MPGSPPGVFGRMRDRSAFQRRENEMAKLTRAQAKAHAEAENLLLKDRLSDDEREFVLEHWHEGANHVNGASGAFFTPTGLAADLSIDAAGSGCRVIDLCAGIGALSFYVHHRSKWNRVADITCVEINPRYVEIGRKILPEARWIQADVLDWRTLNLGRFDVAFGNPPWGKVPRSGTGPRYTGPLFELHVIDIASQLANRGVFLIPQQSAPFRFSGSQCMESGRAGPGQDFERRTGLALEPGCGVDTSIYARDWKDGAPACEVVCIDFEDAPRSDFMRQAPASAPVRSPKAAGDAPGPLFAWASAA
jgi:SAM-dependent methyltransferase